MKTIDQLDCAPPAEALEALSVDMEFQVERLRVEDDASVNFRQRRDWETCDMSLKQSSYSSIVDTATGRRGEELSFESAVEAGFVTVGNGFIDQTAVQAQDRYVVIRRRDVCHRHAAYVPAVGLHLCGKHRDELRDALNDVLHAEGNRAALESMVREYVAEEAQSIIRQTFEEAWS